MHAHAHAHDLLWAELYKLTRENPIYHAEDDETDKGVYGNPAETEGGSEMQDTSMLMGPNIEHVARINGRMPGIRTHQHAGILHFTATLGFCWITIDSFIGLIVFCMIY